MSRLSCSGRARVALRRLLAAAIGLSAALACPVAAHATPGLAPLAPQVALPTESQGVSALAMYRGAVHALVVESARDRTAMRLQYFDEGPQAWLPVAGPLSVAATGIKRPQLLSTRLNELYAAWVEKDTQSNTRWATVARLAPDGHSWTRLQIMNVQGSVWLAQVHGEVWVAWHDQERVRVGRITGDMHLASTRVVPSSRGELRGFVGYGDAATLVSVEPVAANHSRLRATLVGRDFLETGASRERLVGVATGRIGEVFVTAGDPDDPMRPIVSWNAEGGIRLARMLPNGGDFEEIPVAPLLVLRSLREVRGLTVTPAGIALAAARPDGSTRVYTICGPPRALTITAGDPLPDAVRYPVSLVPAPVGAPSGTLIVGYAALQPAHPLRGVVMRYSL